MLRKIVLSVAIAFTISFTILFVALFFYQYKIQDGVIVLRETTDYKLEKNFYLHNNDKNLNKIFIIGSSEVLSLNASHIHDSLLKNNQNFSVYNLSEGGDKPKVRINTLDLIIKANPKIVLYGISYRDFEYPYGKYITSENNEKLLPDPSQVIKNFTYPLTEFLYNKFDFLENPKFTTLDAIRNFNIRTMNNESNDIKYIPYQNTPFFKITNENIQIRSGENLTENLSNKIEYGILPFEKNVNAIDLKEIINTLHDHNIQVIIFTTPYHKVIRDRISDSDKKTLDSILKTLSRDTNVPVFQLQDRYSNLNIWTNPNHLAITDKSLIYSDDISGIILKEMKN